MRENFKKFTSLFIAVIMIIGILPYFSAEAASTIEIGDYLQMGTYYGEPIIWRCVAFEKISGYDANGKPIMDSTDTVTEYKDGYLPLMLSDKILSVKCYDAKGTSEYGSHGRGYYANGKQGYYRQQAGSNYWGDSNIRDWLNSYASTGCITWSCGNPPTSDNVYNNAYDSEQGFLRNFSNKERAAMKQVIQKSLLDDYEYSDPNNIKNINAHTSFGNIEINNVVQNYSTAYSEQVIDTMFLLDVKQVNTMYNNGYILGDDYYIGRLSDKCAENAYGLKDGLSGGDSWNYWLRSPAFGYGSAVRYVIPDGTVVYVKAYVNGGVRPAFYLDSTDMWASGTGTKNSPYVIDNNSVSKENHDIEIEIRDPLTKALVSGEINIQDANGKTTFYIAYNGKVNASSLAFPLKSIFVFHNNYKIDVRRKNVAYPSSGKLVVYLTENEDENIEPDPGNSGNSGKQEHIISDWPYSPDVYSKDLAVEAINLADDAYGENAEIKGYSAPADPSKLKKTMEYLNCDNIVDSGTWNDDNMHNCSFVMGYKHLSNGEKIIYVAVRGTDSIEWIGNMDFCNDPYDPNCIDEYSFRQAANDLETKLENYLKEHNLVYSNCKLFITGHSRGAAIANLVAADYNEKNLFSEVYAYTFATPNTTINPKKYNNIFNFCYAEDFVPQFPIEKWGYGKHGITYSVSAKKAYNENSNYKNKINSLLDRTKYGKLFDQQGFYFNLKRRKTMTDGVYSAWKTPKRAYNRNLYTMLGNRIPTNAFGPTFHDFMKNGIGTLMAKNEGLGIILNTLLYKEYLPVTGYFIIGNKLNDYITYTHLSATYEVGVLCDIFTNSDYVCLTSADDETALMDITYPDEPNTTETEKIKAFLNTDDNKALLGYDENDISTWNGIVLEGNNIKSIDMSFKELTGNLDLSNFAALEDLNITGNNINSLNLSGCSNLKLINANINNLEDIKLKDCVNLEELNCSSNMLSELDLSDCNQLRILDCSINLFTTLDISDISTLCEIYCNNNLISEFKINENANIEEFDISNNYLDLEDKELIKIIEKLKTKGNNNYIISQNNKIDGSAYSEKDITVLNNILLQDNNSDILKWNLEEPDELTGIVWETHNNINYISSINLSNINISGNIEISDLQYLKDISFNETNINDIILKDNPKLYYISAYSAKLKSLSIENCPITVLYADDNYISDINIDDLELKAFSLKNQRPDMEKYEVCKNEYNAISEFLTDDNITALGWDKNKPDEWNGVVWDLIDNVYHIISLDLSFKNISGELDLSDFEYLKNINMSSTNINKIVLPKNITEINDNAFYECYELKEVIMSDDVSYIGEDVFYKCSALKKIELSNNIKNIGDSSFRECDSLKYVELPKTLQSIGDSAFYGCNNLNGITCYESVKNMGKNIFDESSDDLILYCTEDSAAHKYAEENNIKYSFEKYSEILKNNIDYTVNGVDTVYDGKLHSIVITISNNAENADITYSTDNETYSNENPTFINAGEYTVYYKISKNGYKTVSGSEEVVITAVKPTVSILLEKDLQLLSIGTTTDTYTIKAAVTGVENGSAPTGKIEFTVNYTKTEADITDGIATIEAQSLIAGNNTIKAVYIADENESNYINSDEITFTGDSVVDKTIGTASVSMDDWTEGEDVKMPVAVSETNGTDNIIYQYKVKGADDSTYTSNVPSAAGEYTVKAVFAETDIYAEISVTDDFEIKQNTEPTQKPAVTEIPIETSVPSIAPTKTPIATETPAMPTSSATEVPTTKPENTPTVSPTIMPTGKPSIEPTISPTPSETSKPDATQTPELTDTVTVLGKYKGNIEVKKAAEGNKVVFTVNSLIDTNILDGIILFAAQYDSDGKMTGVKIVRGTVNNNSLVIEADIPASDRYKFMLWDKYNSPIIKAVTEV